MRIVEAIITGCHRFSLRNVWRLTYKPEMDVQIILGTNGSGKSSLAELLSPLPAPSSDFSKGGSSNIKIEHKGNLYRTVSDFKSSTRYYFYHIQADGSEVNKNEGGTATAQRELVRQVFGLTPEIHQLLLGKLKFHNMTPMQRRHWITLFTPTDLDFAFKLYGELKTANRDTTGALKHIQNRVSVETSKLMDMEDIGKLEIHAKQLRDELNLLLLNKEQGVPKGWDTEAQLNAVMRNIEKSSKVIVDLQLQCPLTVSLPTPHNMADIDTAVSELRQKLNFDEHMLVHFTNEYMNLEGLLKTLELTGVAGIEELSVRLEELEASEIDILGKIQEFHVPANTDQINTATTAVFETLVSIFTNMPANEAKRYNQEAYGESSRRADTLRYDIDRRLNRISQLEDRLAHLEHTEDTQCPKCSHQWKPGARPDEDVMLKGTIDEIRTDIASMEKELQMVGEYLEGANAYMTAIRHYKNITLQYPNMSMLWSAFAEFNRFCMSPKECLVLLYVWQADLRHCQALEAVVIERKSLSEALGHASRMNQTGSGHFTERGQKLNAQIADTTDQIGVLKNQLSQLVAYKNTMNRLTELKAEVVRDINRMVEIQDLMLRITRDELIGNCIDNHQNALALTNQVLNQKSTLEGIVADLQSNAAGLMIDKEAFQLLDDILSPTEGFIAEQLHGTIQDIVRQLNTIIGAMWTYDFTVLGCNSVNGELDYKFPVQGESGTLKSDVSEGSEAQQGIVDLAFRLLAYTHLGLVDYPLYLDETGREFDEQHRINLMNYVKESLGGHQFSQAFMISHYAANHGSFLHADITVLDSANVVVPDKHNTCIEFEYGNAE